MTCTVWHTFIRSVHCSMFAPPPQCRIIFRDFFLDYLSKRRTHVIKFQEWDVARRELFPLLNVIFQGYRYKCLVCPDFDLCSECESNRIHEGHTVVRIPNSETDWKGQIERCMYGIRGNSNALSYSKLDVHRFNGNSNNTASSNDYSAADFDVANDATSNGSRNDFDKSNRSSDNNLLSNLVKHINSNGEDYIRLFLFLFLHHLFF